MWITVHREISPWDAHIVAGLLQSEGVHAKVLFDQMMTLRWQTSLAYGMVQVQVPDAQAGQAQHILQAWRAGEYEAALARELGLPGAVRCPRCSGYRWRARRDGRSRLFATACLFVLGGIFPAELSGRQCGACGLRQTLKMMDEGATT